MNVLSMGLPFGTPGEPLLHFESRRGHVVRTVAIDGEADYLLAPGETASQLVARVRREWPPDCLLCWCPEVAPPPLEIEACPIKTIAAVSDWTVYFPQLEHNLQRYDAVVTDRLGAQTLQLPGAAPLCLGPLYARRTGIHRPLGIARDIDIAFAGNLNHAAHVQRGRLLETVAAFAGRYRVEISGGHDPESYTRLLNRARIVFNFGLRREMNLRCFETIACGALLFMEETNLEIQDWLRDRHEIVLYRPDNLEALLEHYLARPEETARLAAQAHARAEELSGENRLDPLLDALEALPSRERPFHALGPRDRLMAEVMQYGSSSHDAHRAHVARCVREGRAAFPGDVAWKAMEACTLLDGLPRLEDAPRKENIRRVLELFQECVRERPDAAVLWLNLAFVSRHANARDAETRFLELALDAPSADFGGLLAGERRDPYYGRWREALAFSNASIEILWAAAAARLAALRLEAGRPEDARALAEQSIAWLDGISPPYQSLAQARQTLGDPAAAATLEQGLSYTAFDAQYRQSLIACWTRLGECEKAAALAAESAVLFSALQGGEEAAQCFAALA